MAFLAVVAANGTTIIATKDVSSASDAVVIAKIREAFGGTTNAQTAAAVLDFLVPALRTETRRRLLEKRYATDYAAVNAGQEAEDADFTTEFP